MRTIRVALLVGGFSLLAWGLTFPGAGHVADGQQASHFLVFLEARPTFLEDATVGEQQIVAGHFQYLQSLLKGGHLVMAGRQTDMPFGIVVLA